MSDGRLAAALREIADGRRAASELSVVYDDVHGLWGGDRFVAEAPAWSDERLRDLARLLVELEAWSPSAPDRMGVPDEVLVTVTVSVGGERVVLREWARDLAKNVRLSRACERIGRER